VFKKSTEEVQGPRKEVCIQTFYGIVKAVEY